MFDTKWESWFKAVEIPNPKDTKRAIKDAREAPAMVHDVAQYADEDHGHAADKAANAAEKEIEGAIECLIEQIEEYSARLLDADHKVEELTEGLSYFLNKYQAVYLQDVDQPLTEIKDWVRDNIVGDYDYLILEGHLLIVMFDEKDRLHFKMRFS